MDRRKKGIFIGYDENIIKQRQIYAPDLRYYIKLSRIEFNENSKGSDLELRLRLPIISNSDIISPNGIPNELLIRNFKGRLKLQSKYQSNLESNLDPKSNLGPNLNTKPKLEPQLNQPIAGGAAESIPTGLPPNNISRLLRIEIPSRPPKRARSPDGNDKDEEPIAKQIRAMLVIGDNYSINDIATNQAKISIAKIGKYYAGELIPIPKTYKEVTEDLTYGLL